MSKTKNSPAEAPNETAEEAETSDAIEAAPAAEKRKTPLEMVRERQANMQAARRGVTKKGEKSDGSAGGGAGADGVSKPVQIKRQMGG